MARAPPAKNSLPYPSVHEARDDPSNLPGDRRRSGAPPAHRGQPHPRRRHRRRARYPRLLRRRRPAALLRRARMLRRPRSRGRRASTCPASRRSSTRRSTPSSCAKRSRPRCSPRTSPSRSGERQEGLRAEVTIAARYPETVSTPESERATQEIYTLFGTAVSSARGTRTLTGVQAQGMTACPCAQGLVADRSRVRLAERGYSPEQIEEIFEAVPVATHNQRGIGTLHIGRPEGSPVEIDARDLLHIVEQSMSSEIYELMKRADEVSVVERAHRRPRFVEDCVREMVRQRLRALPGARRRRLPARPPGEPGDDPSPQRRRRARRHPRGDPRRDRDGRAHPPAPHEARVARVSGRVTAASAAGASPRRRCRWLMMRAVRFAPVNRAGPSSPPTARRSRRGERACTSRVAPRDRSSARSARSRRH